MIEMFLTWTDSLTTGDLPWLTGLLVLAVLLILTYLFRNSLRYWREGHQITRAVKRLGARMLRDVILPDGMGGDISIDFLVLSPDVILVIGIKRYDGMIFGGAQTDEWTQTINSRSYKFPNPDYYLLQQVSAVRRIVPKTPTRGLHLFTDNAVFPWDKPSNVLQVKDLRSSSTRRPRPKDIPEELRAAWTQLTRSLNQ
ncbi:MAG: nuclease-related domain-containing protein [Pseudomonadota bacterium]